MMIYIRNYKIVTVGSQYEKRGSNYRKLLKEESLGSVFYKEGAKEEK